MSLWHQEYQHSSWVEGIFLNIVSFTAPKGYTVPPNLCTLDRSGALQDGKAGCWTDSNSVKMCELERQGKCSNSVPSANGHTGCFLKKGMIYN